VNAAERKSGRACMTGAELESRQVFSRKSGEKPCSKKQEFGCGFSGNI